MSAGELLLAPLTWDGLQDRYEGGVAAVKRLKDRADNHVDDVRAVGALAAAHGLQSDVELVLLAMIQRRSAVAA